ncbi:MAG: ABC transporter permease [Bacilli bacterium]|nr:ABC transporter permease [Bacilli bacterium]
MKHKKLKNIFIGLVLFFLYLPIIVLVVYSFNTSKMNIVFEGFTFDWYKNLFNNRDLIEAFINTLIIAVTSTVVSTIIGTLGAVGLNKYDFKFKSFINLLIYIPIVIPEIVLGISLLSIYTLTKIELGMFTLILSHIAFSIPFVIVSVRSTLSSTLKTYEEAAKDLGANSMNTFFKVTLPQMMPGVISGAILAFTLSLDDVVISYFTSGPGSNTLPLKIYSMIKTGISPDVNALSTLMLLATMIILTTSAIIQSRKIVGGTK